MNNSVEVGHARQRMRERAYDRQEKDLRPFCPDTIVMRLKRSMRNYVTRFNAPDPCVSDFGVSTFENDGQKAFFVLVAMMRFPRRVFENSTARQRENGPKIRAQRHDWVLGIMSASVNCVQALDRRFDKALDRTERTQQNGAPSVEIKALPNRHPRCSPLTDQPFGNTSSPRGPRKRRR